MRHALACSILWSALIAGCSTEDVSVADVGPAGPDVGDLDSGPSFDAGTVVGLDADHGDTGAELDAAMEARDAGPALDADEPSDAQPGIDSRPGPDASTPVPTPGFGTISGPCGVLDPAILTSTRSALYVNRIDFGADPYDDADYPLLSAGGREMIDDGNAGGSSLYSEVFSFELLHRCEGARLLKTETEILYSPPQGTITDILVEIDGLKIGVSVTRAVAFPFDQPYPPARALSLLEDKLSGIHASTAHVDPADAWEKQILYVIAYAEGHVAVLEAALSQLDPATIGDTIVMISVSDGDDDFIY